MIFQHTFTASNRQATADRAARSRRKDPLAGDADRAPSWTVRWMVGDIGTGSERKGGKRMARCVNAACLGDLSQQAEAIVDAG